ncbi:hypothetical protein THZG08_670004 [Vibrio owensii]|nr:hypothetical protein THZG08_670004 [Vibrio owensii]CAH1589619.1 hypothetical protein THOA03_660004 [Vibrio owensii]
MNPALASVEPMTLGKTPFGKRLYAFLIASPTFPFLSLCKKVALT